MNVVLEHSTPLYIAAYAARVCTDTTERCNSEADYALLKNIIDMGHESVLEHINYTFLIEGISRALLQELARHRHISLSVESSRYTLKKHITSNGCKFVLPTYELGPSIFIKVNKVKVNKVIDDCLQLISAIYEDNLPSDVAKYFIPECLTTRLVMTCNLRELRHIYRIRSSKRAFPEFQTLMAEIKSVLPEQDQHLLTRRIEGLPAQEGTSAQEGVHKEGCE